MIYTYGVLHFYFLAIVYKRITPRTFMSSVSVEIALVIIIPT